MEVIKTKLDGVLLIRPEIWEDFRGDYVMTYNEKLYREHGIDVKFVEHDISTSTRGVLRGIHYDPACWKIYEIFHGSAYYVLVDCEEGSPTFGKWESFILTDRNHWQIFKPPKYGAGFLALTNMVVLHYLQSEYYDPRRQKTFRWNDPRLKIWWPSRNPILSQRDEMR